MYYNVAPPPQLEQLLCEVQGDESPTVLWNRPIIDYMNRNESAPVVSVLMAAGSCGINTRFNWVLNTDSDRTQWQSMLYPTYTHDCAGTNMVSVAVP